MVYIKKVSFGVSKPRQHGGHGYTSELLGRSPFFHNIIINKYIKARVYEGACVGRRVSNSVSLR